MAVRVKVRIVATGGVAKAPRLDTVAIASSGFESDQPGALLPVNAAQKLGLWPAPPGSRTDQFESPGAAFAMTTVPKGIRVWLTGEPVPPVDADAVIAVRETEVVLNDALVEALRLHLEAVHRGVYRVGAKGKLRRSAKRRTW